jgi:hypothetical protein
MRFDTDKPEGDPPLGTGWKLRPGLPGLNQKWSFGGSPLSNVTVAAGLFTGVLAANDPLSTILGDDANEIAVLIVAAALATGLTAAAPIVLDLLRDEPGKYTSGEPVPNNYTGLGVLAAGVTVATGSLGLIGTVTATLWNTTPINRAVLLVSALAVAGVVVAYSARATRRTFKIGELEESPGTDAPAMT